MNEQTVIINSVSCESCGGAGVIAGNRCQACRGMGGGVVAGHYFYYFYLPVTRLSIFLRKSRQRIFNILDGSLLILAAAGVFAAVWWFYQASSAGSVEALYFWQVKSPWLGVFWLTMLFDLFLVFRFNRRQEKLKKISPDWWIDNREVGPEVELKEAVKGRQFVNAADCLGEEALSALEKAYIWAGDLGHAEVDPLHYFYALLGDSRQLAGWLDRLDFDRATLADKLKRQAALLAKPPGRFDFSPALKTAVINGCLNALRQHRHSIEAMDMVLPTRNASKVLGEIFYDSGVDEDKLGNLVEWFNVDQRSVANFKIFRDLARFKPGSSMDRAYTALATPLLDSVGRDLTLSAKYNELPMCVSREAELEQILSALESGRPGVLLVGQAGVGKKTLVGGLAQAMVMEKVPLRYKDKRLVEVDVARLIGGAGPAEAQARLLAIINEVNQAGNVVVFFPDLENLLGFSAGNEASLDLSEILADALDRGGLGVIASATEENYRKFLENTSLAKSLVEVKVVEPDNNRAILMTESKIASLEARFKVYYTYEAIEAAVKLTAKFDHENYLPDKAVKLLTEAAPQMTRRAGGAALIDQSAVTEFISSKVKIPLGQATGDEGRLLLDLEDKMHQRLIGQDEAVKMTAESLRRARAELREGKKPIASFLFLGPTGVGKTELAKTLATVYFGAEAAMVRLDMSEYQGDDAVVKMIGSPEGPKGYLTEKIRQAPFSLLLLDEIEKANPGILDLFLQVIDDGRLTDGSGKTIDFTNSIIIATSNIGALAIKEAVGAGRNLSDIKEEITDRELLKVLRPEFVNRFDGIALFKPLSLSEVTEVTALMLDKLAETLDAKGVKLEYRQAGLSVLAKEGYHPEYGARPLKRLLQDKIENDIAKRLLSGEIGRRDTVVINESGAVEVIKAKAL